MPICCVPLILRRCGVLLRTPHSSGFRAPCIWTFLYSLPTGCFSTPSFAGMTLQRIICFGGYSLSMCLLGVYDSNSPLEMPDCRIIDWSVPIRSSVWLGTGTVTVVSGSCFCITIWLPRCRISTNPCRARGWRRLVVRKEYGAYPMATSTRVTYISSCKRV